jgi:hypothetical protein
MYDGAMLKKFSLKLLRSTTGASGGELPDREVRQTSQ